MKPEAELGIGVIGCGGFGLFALQQFLQTPNTKLIAIAGTHNEPALAAAELFGAKNLEYPEDLVKHPDVDLIYIANPPFLHYEHTVLSLSHGKHVLCEKPMAMDQKQVNEMLRLAASKDLLLVTNLMQRYNPLYKQLQKVLEKKILGEMIHGYFENYASDEGLPANHWFWDITKSGGIFIEHGVHFFDMFEGWLGKGEVTGASIGIRPGTDIEEQVQATVRYQNNILVNFYHGFHQAGRMDRQEMKLVFEKGDITLFEWIPTRMHINAILNEEDTKQLVEIFPNARLKVTESYGGKNRLCSSRHKPLDVYQKIFLTYGYEEQKLHTYSDLLLSMFKDQKAFLNDRTHKRVITEKNGYNSLLTAVAADDLARRTQNAKNDLVISFKNGKI